MNTMTLWEEVVWTQWGKLGLLREVLDLPPREYSFLLGQGARHAQKKYSGQVHAGDA